MSTMLYKSPGEHTFEGVSCDYVIVDEAEVESKLAEGWNLTWHGADQDAKDRDAAKLAENEKALAKVEQQLSTLKAVHKGRGVWEVQDADGNTVQVGLTKEEALAKAGGSDAH